MVQQPRRVTHPCIFISDSLQCWKWEWDWLLMWHWRLIYRHFWPFWVPLNISGWHLWSFQVPHKCQDGFSLAHGVIGCGVSAAGLCRCHSDQHDELCPGNRCTSQISLIFMHVLINLFRLISDIAKVILWLATNTGWHITLFSCFRLFQFKSCV